MIVAIRALAARLMRPPGRRHDRRRAHHPLPLTVPAQRAPSDGGSYLRVAGQRHGR